MSTIVHCDLCRNFIPHDMKIHRLVSPPMADSTDGDLDICADCRRRIVAKMQVKAMGHDVETLLTIGTKTESEAPLASLKMRLARSGDGVIVQMGGSSAFYSFDEMRRASCDRDGTWLEGAPVRTT